MKTTTTTPATNPRPGRSTTKHLHLNRSNLNSEFSGKPDEDAEAHLLYSNDWMNAHCFVNSVKVQRFCFTLLREARLWYHSPEPLNVDWPKFQNLFRQRYSKVGNMQEQLFHAWGSFNSDENTGPYILMLLKLGRQQHF